MHGGFMRLLVLVVSVWMSVAVCLGVEQAVEPDGAKATFVKEDEASTKQACMSFWTDAWKLPKIIIEEDKKLVSKDENLLLLLGAAGGSIALHAGGGDRRVADHFDSTGNLNPEVDKITDYVGGPGLHFAVTGLWYLTSARNSDDLNQQRAWTMLKALSVTGATTLGLKMVRNNRTPNDKLWAWPSGHTSSSFTVASVLDEMYGPEVGIPAYLGAGFVGYRMMDSGDHWASDVLFGGILGYLIGHQIAGEDKKLELAGFNVMPFTANIGNENVMGVRLTRRF